VELDVDEGIFEKHEADEHDLGRKQSGQHVIGRRGREFGDGVRMTYIHAYGDDHQIGVEADKSSVFV
jgi:hypothetical protein